MSSGTVHRIRRREGQHKWRTNTAEIFSEILVDKLKEPGLNNIMVHRNRFCRRM
jgi:hypothetical protein